MAKLVWRPAKAKGAEFNAAEGAGYGAQRVEGAEGDVGMGALFRGEGFGEEEVAEGGGAERENARAVGGGGDGDFAEEAAECGAEDEAEAEGHADEAEVLGAFLGFGDVGDAGHGGGDVAAADAVDDAGKVHDPEGAGPAEQEVAGGGADDGDDENGAAAEAVREDAEGWGGEELCGGEGDRKHADGEGVGAELADEVGNDGDEDAGTEEIEEDGEEDEGQRAPLPGNEHELSVSQKNS
jgi:hypothetical protein